MYKLRGCIVEAGQRSVKGKPAMSATMIERQENTVTIQITVELSRSMLDSEAEIQKVLNEAGVLATAEALKQFDTDGSPLVMGATRWTSKGQEPKTYQTPYGETVVARHVYQRGEGGATFCPLERDARLILTSTRRFAMQIRHKYGEGPAARVKRDLENNHGRKVSDCFIQDTAAVVASVVAAKEEEWQYQTPKLDKPVATIGLGLDGSCLFMVEQGQRQVNGVQTLSRLVDQPLRQGGRASAHHLPGGQSRVWQGEVPPASVKRDQTRQRDLSRGQTDRRGRRQQ